MARVRGQAMHALGQREDVQEADVCSQYCFRLNALEGNIPGVRKASW